MVDLTKTCPYCGAQLPAGASFCPRCARSIRAQKTIQPPSHLWGKVLRWGLAAAVAIAVVAGVVYAQMPKTYEGLAEVIYTDRDGTYQLILGAGEERFTPVPEYTEQFARDVLGRMPSRLFINHVDSGANAGDIFLQKVESVTAEFKDQGDNPSPMICDPPAPADYSKDAALVSRLSFTGESGTEELVWTLNMKNGDTIRLRQYIIITPLETYEYHYQDYPMNTAEELQALVDQVSKEVEMPNEVHFYLPPVTYEGGLSIGDRPINLHGCTDGPQRTTFTDTVSLVAQNGPISYFYDIDFVGNGEGIGVSASARFWGEGCSFTGWKTGVLGYGDVWVNVIACQFRDNEVGFHFNSEGEYASHTMFNENLFQNNGTAVLLERVPTDTVMNFQGSRFTGNGIDIDNRSNQPIDITKAIIE
ncbi:zinc-ribbon domain-containing protein [Flavonifractor sp. An100]|uniref:zinc-ribbon domain-containing protein n=1 Tax=Flavonifractor sp. An100 TaxID=1965538 RepID=UPI000B39D56B|nr:zinc-ribbon domain-containing protein [Flavonifractor sp. An100]OUQ77706.1 hypothetical protein B5E43_09970 [Flavonifractor sp. An100]